MHASKPMEEKELDRCEDKVFKGRLKQTHAANRRVETQAGKLKARQAGRHSGWEVVQKTKRNSNTGKQVD